MYISEELLFLSIKKLRECVHPFLGITFVTCKKINLPIGKGKEISLDAETKKHLNSHHKLLAKSKYYFQPFKSNKWWVTQKYPSSGLQTVNTQTFSQTFEHNRNEKKWGFSNDYISTIQQTLQENRLNEKCPAWALAIWLYKNENISGFNRINLLIDKFYDEYNITKSERNEIFDRTFPTEIEYLFDNISDTPLSYPKILKKFPDSPDAEKEIGLSIKSISIDNTDLSKSIKWNFGERLNLITGDNGLGKSFLLDFSWWAATGSSTKATSFPLGISLEHFPPKVTHAIATRSGRTQTSSHQFNFQTNTWETKNKPVTIEALGIFSRADGSFAIYDPVKPNLNSQSSDKTLRLTNTEVWDGKPGYIEGLVRDWVRWQQSENKIHFDRFKAILRKLSPEDLGFLEPEAPIRIPGDPREIPTIRHKYGTVPVTHASSGVQRVLQLTYLIMWAWMEHELEAKRQGKISSKKLLLLVDELEAHLHPKWQRIVLPSLLTVGDLLSAELTLQIIAATHSPMILASIEPYFDSETDALGHLHTQDGKVELEELPFVKYGDATGWLTSPVFGLRHARSPEAELAIERAKTIQLDTSPSEKDVQEVSEQLKLHLPTNDRFWPRWISFAERFGASF